MFNVRVIQHSYVKPTGGGPPHLVDSYPTSNNSGYIQMSYGDNQFHALGQSFTGDGSNLVQADFYLARNTALTGTVYAKLYAHTGTFGSTGTPTGSALATASIDASTLTGTLTVVSFTFDGTYTLVNGTKYFIVVEYAGGDDFNMAQVGYDSSSPTHAGNHAWYYLGPSWTANANYDLIFYIYGS